jgi:hypothetical protein
VLRILQRMPPGTVGVEAVGKVTEEDYRRVLEPALTQASQEGRIRLLFVLGDEFGSLSPGATWADTKLWARHLKGWERIAIVSDADWLEHAATVFGWMMPGQVKVFETDDVADAKSWLVGIEDDDD